MIELIIFVVIGLVISWGFVVRDPTVHAIYATVFLTLTALVMLLQ